MSKTKYRNQSLREQFGENWRRFEKIKFSQVTPKCDRRHYINDEDILVVLSRLPFETWIRLRRVHFNDEGQGVRLLASVTRGRREIAVCALPPRVSLTRFLTDKQSPLQFGAQRGCQWPRLAVRRYLLYDVFLHELGHLQIVDEKAKNVRRKYASQTLAQDFADYWRGMLWRKSYEHEDSVHNPPPRKHECIPK